MMLRETGVELLSHLNPQRTLIRIVSASGVGEQGGSLVVPLFYRTNIA